MAVLLERGERGGGFVAKPLNRKRGGKGQPVPVSEAVTFAGSSPTGHGAEIQIVDFGNGVQGVYLLVDADKGPESIINVVSDHALTAADFVL